MRILCGGNILLNTGFADISDDGFGDYTVGDFAEDNPNGVYVLSMPGQHVVTIVDSVIYDTWDSSNEGPSYFFSKKSSGDFPATYS